MYQELEAVNVDMLFAAIRDDMYHVLPEDMADWMAPIAQRYPSLRLMSQNMDRVRAGLRERRPELLAVIDNTAGGRDWLQLQMAFYLRQLEEVC